MTEALSAADRSALVAEQGPVTMSVGGVLVFEAGPGLEHTRVLERVGQRLHLVPRYRQRLQSAAPGVTNPVWVDDEQFDLGWHVRRAALPAPGGPEELGVLSYDGGVHFGLLADRDLDPPLGAMRAALEDATNGRFAPPDRG